MVSTVSGMETALKHHRRRHPIALWKSVLFVIGGLVLLCITSFRGRFHTSTSGVAFSVQKATSGELRSKKIVLDPHELVLSNTLVHYQLPPLTSKEHHQEQHQLDIAGVVFLFHGCYRDGIDWFQLPEEQAIVQFLLTHSHAVVAFSSPKRTGSRCWSNTFPAQENVDVEQVTRAWHQMQNDPEILGSLFYQEENPKNVPLYGIGASSGGTFVTILHQTIGFHGMEVMISPGHPEAIQWMAIRGGSSGPDAKSERMARPVPRVALVYMPKDTQFAGEGPIQWTMHTLTETRPTADATTSTSTTNNSNQSIQVKAFACEPKAITAQWLSDRIEHLSLVQAAQIMNLISSSPLNLIDRESGLLQVNPREYWSQIEQAMSESIQPSLDDVTVAGIQESLNLADGIHELTSDYVADVYSFWKQ
jgi:hypothetical protein